MNKWGALKPAKIGPSISHLFFADNLIFFSKTTKAHIMKVMDTLNSFCIVSGQKISIEKSEFFGHNVNRNLK